ncbi:hypothetical protein ROT00_15640 [Agromyces mediolanus]|uniref:hypothetical protein n=1 Tax=Agromyces mediolanus TaxID=41986 RepID=UPI003833B160
MRSPLGPLAFAAGLIALLVTLGFRLALSALYWNGALTIGTLGSIAPIVHVAQFAVADVFAAAAIIAGVVALVRRAPRPALAGAGIALGAAAVAELLVGLLLGPYPLFN